MIWSSLKEERWPSKFTSIVWERMFLQPGLHIFNHKRHSGVICVVIQCHWSNWHLKKLFCFHFFKKSQCQRVQIRDLWFTILLSLWVLLVFWKWGVATATRYCYSCQRCWGQSQLVERLQAKHPPMMEGSWWKATLSKRISFIPMGEYVCHNLTVCDRCGGGGIYTCCSSTCSSSGTISRRLQHVLSFCSCRFAPSVDYRGLIHGD